MPAAVTHRALLVTGAAATYAAVTVAFVALETPGLGIGHAFYLAVALTALSTGPVVGAAGGLVATGLYVVGVVLNPALTNVALLDPPTLIRATTYVSCGVLIGWFAREKRLLVAELHDLAGRDFLTGLLNTRAFERSLERRCASPRRFTLLLADLDGLKQVNDREGHAAGNELLSRAGAGLAAAVRDGEEVARVGGDEFAVLAAVVTPDEARALAGRLQDELARTDAPASVGWALYPADGATALALYRRADERLYAAKLDRRTNRELASLLGGS